MTLRGMRYVWVTIFPFSTMSVSVPPEASKRVGRVKRRCIPLAWVTWPGMIVAAVC